MFFFFSSRRRHTRLQGDWSSDVCSSDLVARPVYAPALVAFIGGVNWSLSLSWRDEPAIGWFPLAPREVYVPSYRASVSYVRNVNVTNVTNVTNITNQTINNASGANAANFRHANQQFATVVPQTAFVGARPVAQAAIRVPNNAGRSRSLRTPGSGDSRDRFGAGTGSTTDP